jgi:hypothetical protein
MKFGHPDPEQGCDIPTIKDSHYSFNQNTDVIETPPSHHWTIFVEKQNITAVPKLIVSIVPQ